MQEMLAVMGSVLLLIISVCAYILKNLMDSNHRIELSLTRLLSEHDNLSSTVRHNQKLIGENKASVDDLKYRVHALEGTQPSVLEYMKQVDRELEDITKLLNSKL